MFNVFKRLEIYCEGGLSQKDGECMICYFVVCIISLWIDYILYILAKDHISIFSHTQSHHFLSSPYGSINKYINVGLFVKTRGKQWCTLS